MPKHDSTAPQTPEEAGRYAYLTQRSASILHGDPSRPINSDYRNRGYHGQDIARFWYGVTEEQDDYHQAERLYRATRRANKKSK